MVELLDQPHLDSAPLIVDATGVGRGVVDLFRDAHRDGLLGRYPIPVTITAGAAANGLHVPKQDLVSRIQALLQTGRLLIAEAIPLREQLECELAGLTAKTSASGRTTYEALTERIHDDLVTALGLAVWHPGHKAQPRIVGRSGRIYASSELVPRAQLSADGRLHVGRLPPAPRSRAAGADQRHQRELPAAH